MRLPAASTRDPLDVNSLPPTGNTELNHRTKPLTDAEERQQTYKLLLSAALIIAPVGLVVSWFWAFKWLVLPVLITGALLFLGRAFFQYTRERRQPWSELGAAALIALSALLGWLFYSLPTHQVGYLLVFPVTLAWAFGFALVVAKQVAGWMANHPKVHWEVARQWESFFPGLKSWTVPADCPEVRSVQVAPVLLFVSFGVGWLVVLQLERSIAWEFAALLGIVGFGLAAILLTAAWNLTGVGSRFSLRLMLRVTWKALTVWCNYNRHETKAAGVFRFPTPPFRKAAAVRDNLDVGHAGRAGGWAHHLLSVDHAGRESGRAGERTVHSSS